MLTILNDFRDKLDYLMEQCLDRRIIIYGYGYSGRFVAWYAEYYHSIRADYIITEEYSNSIPYEFPLFRKTLLDFDYKDVKNAVVWLCTEETEEKTALLLKHGYKKGENYFDINEIVYGKRYDHSRADTNIQFLRYLEEKYQCDFVDRMDVLQFDNVMEGMCPYVGLSPKELFPLLDKCHVVPNIRDGIFDFGCGKGAAMLSFLDYGFKRVGGVEYANNLFDICMSNFSKIDIKMEGATVEFFHDDARNITQHLDGYNWFYFFHPFDESVMQVVIDNICESILRFPRKAYIISVLPFCHRYIEATGMFVLTNQFEIMTRQRVVDIFVAR